VQTSAVQNSAELAHFRSSAGGTRRLSAPMAALLLYRGHCSMAAAALWPAYDGAAYHGPAYDGMTALHYGGAAYGGTAYGGTALWRCCL
jgi:hypothetical protein